MPLLFSIKTPNVKFRCLNIELFSHKRLMIQFIGLANEFYQNSSNQLLVQELTYCYIHATENHELVYANC